MLSVYGFHDSAIEGVTHTAESLRIRLDNVEDFQTEGVEYLSKVELCFSAVCDVYVNTLPADKIEMESPFGELYSLTIKNNVATMTIFLQWTQPRRTLTKDISFRFDSMTFRVIERTIQRSEG